MTTLELVELLNTHKMPWSPVSNCPALFCGTWNSYSQDVRDRFPAPVIGKRYAYWPQHEFQDDVDPESLI